MVGKLSKGGKVGNEVTEIRQGPITQGPADGDSLGIVFQVNEKSCRVGRDRSR